MKKVKFTKKAAALILATVMLVGGVGGSTLAWLTHHTGPVSNTFTKSDVKVTITETDTDPNTDGDQHKYKMVPGWSIDKDPVVTVDRSSEDCYLFLKVEETGGNVTTGAKPSVNHQFDSFIDYTIDSDIEIELSDNSTLNMGWTLLESINNIDEYTENDDDGGIYYMVIDTEDKKGVDYNVLAGGTHTFEGVIYTWGDKKVLTKPSVTKEMMDKLTPGTTPELKFTAYVVQLWKKNKPDVSDFDDGDAYNTAVDDAKFKPAEAWAQVSN